MPLFKPGDFVTSKAQARAIALMPKTDKPSFLDTRPPLLIGQVIEVTQQTCPGGTQTHYAVRWAGLDNVGNELRLYNEIELAGDPV